MKSDSRKFIPVLKRDNVCDRVPFETLEFSFGFVFFNRRDVYSTGGSGGEVVRQGISDRIVDIVLAISLAPFDIESNLIGRTFSYDDLIFRHFL